MIEDDLQKMGVIEERLCGFIADHLARAQTRPLVGALIMIVADIMICSGMSKEDARALFERFLDNIEERNSRQAILEVNLIKGDAP